MPTTSASRLALVLVVLALCGFLSPAVEQKVSAGSPGTETAGHVVINELYYGVPVGVPFENRTQWVELYNPTMAPVNMTGWTLRFSHLQGSMDLPEGTVLASEGYLLLTNSLSGFGGMWEQVPTEAIEVGFLEALDQGTLLLLDAALPASIVDSLDYGPSLGGPSAGINHSIARYAQGHDTGIPLADFYEDPNPTPGAANTHHVDSLTMSISLPQGRLYSGGDIPLTLAFANGGDIPISCEYPQPGLSIDLSVTFPNGSTFTISAGPGDEAAEALEVGQGLTDEVVVDLGSLAFGATSPFSFSPGGTGFGLSAPGNYTMRAHYRSKSAEGGVNWLGALDSESLSFELLDDPASRLELAVAPLRPSILPGEPALVRVTLRSSLPYEINISDLSAGASVGLEVSAPYGTYRLDARGSAGLAGRVLGPGDSWETEFDLSAGGLVRVEDGGSPASLDLTLTGTYGLTAFYESDVAEPLLGWSGSLTPASASLAVSDFIDLVVSGDSMVLSNPGPAQGEDVTVGVTVSNEGTLSTGAEVMLYDGDPEIGGLLLGKRLVEVPAKGEASAAMSWSGVQGTHTLWVSVTSLDGTESDVTNNMASLEVTVAPAPEGLDLYMTASDISFSDMAPVEGSVVSIYATVHNNGNVPGTARVRFFDGYPAGSANLIGSAPPVVVPVGDARVLSLDWTADNATSRIYAVAVDQEGTETLLSNNMAFADISVGRSDLPRLMLRVVDVRPAVPPPGGIPEMEPGSSLRLRLEVRSLLVSDTVRVRPVGGCTCTLEFTPDKAYLDRNSAVYFETTITASEKRDTTGGVPSAILFRAVGENASSNTATFSFRVVHITLPPDDVAPVVNVGTAALAVGSVSILAALGLGTEFGRYRFLLLLFIPLYTRIAKDGVLDNFTRGKIYGSIATYPGINYTSLKRVLELNAGTLTYHLKVLEREGYIKGARDGRYLCFYPARKALTKDEARRIRGLGVPRRTHDPQSGIQRRIMRVIRASPGISQKGIGRELDESKQLVNYHVKLLEEAGAVRVERTGKRSMCYIQPRRTLQCPRCNEVVRVTVTDEGDRVRCPECGVSGILGTMY